MTPNPDDPLELLRRIRMDLTNAQAKLTDVIEEIAALPSQPPARCPDCGLRFRGVLTLAEHAYHSHGGPVPSHWLAAEEAAGLEPLLAEARAILAAPNAEEAPMDTPETPTPTEPAPDDPTPDGGDDTDDDGE